MKLIEQFVRKVVTAQPQDSLAAVARRMQEHNVGAVVIAERQRPVGIVTDRDLALELGARGTPPECPVVKVMSTPVEIVSLGEGVFDVAELMKEYKVRRLPVVDEDGILVGLVTLDDLLHLLARELWNLTQVVEAEMGVQPALR
jgi:CBS domain-containing protein